MTQQALVFFTGGGSSGHVTPNIAIIAQAKQKAWQVAYVGSYEGIEKTLIEPLHIPYYAISTGKLRRSLDWRNLLMPWQVVQGIWQCYQLCRQNKPAVIFSKGGFVALPLVIGAWLNHIPVIAHESDLSPGLANRLSYPFIKKIALSFPASKKYFKEQTKLVVTGTPIRAEILQGDASNGLAFCGFTQDKPLLMIYGGGLGSVVINDAVRTALPVLSLQFNIVHCCGKGKTAKGFEQYSNYRQYDYLHDELADVMAAADIIVSRAGANSIYELLALRKPHLLIPLSKKISRGDQIENAEYFAAQGLSKVLDEDTLTAETLTKAVDELWQARDDYRERLQNYPLSNAVQELLKLIEGEVK